MMPNFLTCMSCKMFYNLHTTRLIKGTPKYQPTFRPNDHKLITYENMLIYVSHYIDMFDMYIITFNHTYNRFTYSQL